MSRRDIIVKQIDNISKDIEKLKQTQVVTANDRYLTKTHLTPIINKLHQVQRQQKAIEERRLTLI